MLPRNDAAKILAIQKKETGSGGLLTDAAPLLAGRLVEPRLDMPLPVLLYVATGDDVVVLHHLGLLSFLPATANESIQSHDSKNAIQN
jgi:hypothetical protein